MNTRGAAGFLAFATGSSRLSLDQKTLLIGDQNPLEQWSQSLLQTDDIWQRNFHRWLALPAPHTPACECSAGNRMRKTNSPTASPSRGRKASRANSVGPSSARTSCSPPAM